MAANVFANICQDDWFMLSKVGFNSLRLFSLLKKIKNVFVCDTVKILMRGYLKWDASEIFWGRRMV